MHSKPKCIIITGRPGSGKTTLAKKLCERLSLPAISRDEIKEGYVKTYRLNRDQLPTSTNALISDFFFDIVNLYLANNVSIVIEAAFQHDVWEPRMAKIIELSSPCIVLCFVDDEIAERRRGKRSYAEPRFDLPTIRVSTDGEYVPSLDAIVMKINSYEAQR